MVQMDSKIEQILFDFMDSLMESQEDNLHRVEYRLEEVRKAIDLFYSNSLRQYYDAAATATGKMVENGSILLTSTNINTSCLPNIKSIISRDNEEEKCDPSNGQQEQQVESNSNKFVYEGLIHDLTVYKFLLEFVDVLSFVAKTFDTTTNVNNDSDEQIIAVETFLPPKPNTTSTSIEGGKENYNESDSKDDNDDYFTITDATSKDIRTKIYSDEIHDDAKSTLKLLQSLLEASSSTSLEEEAKTIDDNIIDNDNDHNNNDKDPRAVAKDIFYDKLKTVRNTLKELSYYYNNFHFDNIITKCNDSNNYMSLQDFQNLLRGALYLNTSQQPEVGSATTSSLTATRTILSKPTIKQDEEDGKVNQPQGIPEDDEDTTSTNNMGDTQGFLERMKTAASIETLRSMIFNSKEPQSDENKGNDDNCRGNDDDDDNDIQINDDDDDDDDNQTNDDDDDDDDSQSYYDEYEKRVEKKMPPVVDDFDSLLEMIYREIMDEDDDYDHTSYLPFSTGRSVSSKKEGKKKSTKKKKKVSSTNKDHSDKEIIQKMELPKKKQVHFASTLTSILKKRNPSEQFQEPEIPDEETYIHFAGWPTMKRSTLNANTYTVIPPSSYCSNDSRGRTEMENVFTTAAADDDDYDDFSFAETITTT